MSKLTFEVALRTTLANSRLARILEGEEPTHWWYEALREDQRDVEAIIDKLCEDLTLLTGRPVVRFSKLRANVPYPGGPDPMFPVQMAFNHLNRQITNFLKGVMNEIRSEHRSESAMTALITFPISKIWWDKYGAKTALPDAAGKIQNIKLIDPEMKKPSEVEQPKHIRKLLGLCELTNFDYQPYVLADNTGCKILALKLGCEWHDLAIATWEPAPFVTLQKFLGFLVGTCFTGMGLGLWLSWSIETWWVSWPLMILSGAVGVIGGLFTTLLVALLCKPLKL